MKNELENGFPYAERVPGHPYGMAMTDRREHLGFIRISKCGSITATRFFSLRRWQACEKLENSGVPLYAAIRNPVSRLISSIPETLKRKRLKGQDKSDGKFLPEEIRQALLTIDTSSAEKVALSFIDVLQDYGVFDAHHEGMFKFLFAPSGRPYGNPRVVATEELSWKLPLIAASIPWIQKVRPVRTWNGRGRDRAPERTSDQKTRSYHPYHPLFRLSGQPATIESGPLELLLKKLHHEIFASPSVRRAARLFVERHQAEDVLLWQSLEAQSSRIRTGVPLSQLH